MAEQFVQCSGGCFEEMFDVFPGGRVSPTLSFRAERRISLSPRRNAFPLWPLLQCAPEMLPKAEEFGWEAAGRFGVLPADVTVVKGEIIFPRLDLKKELEALESL